MADPLDSMKFTGFTQSNAFENMEADLSDIKLDDASSIWQGSVNQLAQLDPGAAQEDDSLYPPTAMPLRDPGEYGRGKIFDFVTETLSSEPVFTGELTDLQSTTSGGAEQFYQFADLSYKGDDFAARIELYDYPNNGDSGRQTDELDVVMQLTSGQQIRLQTNWSEPDPFISMGNAHTRSQYFEVRSSTDKAKFDQLNNSILDLLEKMQLPEGFIPYRTEQR